MAVHFFVLFRISNKSSMYQVYSAAAVPSASFAAGCCTNQCTRRPRDQRLSAASMYVLVSGVLQLLLNCLTWCGVMRRVRVLYLCCCACLLIVCCCWLLLLFFRHVESFLQQVEIYLLLSPSAGSVGTFLASQEVPLKHRLLPLLAGESFSIFIQVSEEPYFPIFLLWVFFLVRCTYEHVVDHLSTVPVFAAPQAQHSIA